MIGSLVKKVLRKQVSKGARRGAPGWIAMGAFGLLRGGYRRIGRRTESVAFADKLRSGEELVLRHGGEPVRSLRKDRKKAAVIGAVDFARRQLASQAERAKTDAAAAQAEAKLFRDTAKHAESRGTRRKAVKAAAKAARRAVG